MKRSPLSPTRAELLSPSDELPVGATPFERYHHYGARRHSVLWLRANEAAIERAMLYGFDYTTQESKTLISSIVLAVLDVAAGNDAS